MTSKLLFLSKISRPGVFEAVALLAAIIKGQFMDDYNNIGQVIKYIMEDP